MNEADTCRTYVLPKLKSAGWEDETITEQLVLTPRRIVPIGDEQILPLKRFSLASFEYWFITQIQIHPSPAQRTTSHCRLSGRPAGEGQRAARVAIS